jgi:hypothetical protein
MVLTSVFLFVFDTAGLLQFYVQCVFIAKIVLLLHALKLLMLFVRTWIWNMNTVCQGGTNYIIY